MGNLLRRKAPSGRAVVDLLRFPRQRTGGWEESPDGASGEIERLNFPGAIGHPPLMPAALMIGHHFSTSALWNAPRYSGVCSSRGPTSRRSPVSLARAAGSARVFTTAPLSLAIMSCGVPFGAHIACHGAIC